MTEKEQVLQHKLNQALALLSQAQNLLDDVHCDGTKLYQKISDFLEENE